MSFIEQLISFGVETRRALAQTAGIGTGITANEPDPKKAKWLIYAAILCMIIAILLLIKFYKK